MKKKYKKDYVWLVYDVPVSRERIPENWYQSFIRDHQYKYIYQTKKHKITRKIAEANIRNSSGSMYKNYRIEEL